MVQRGRPNILLITTDQHQYQRLGTLDPVLQTPNLDRLAASGTTFTRAYATNPLCTPSRSSIITGLYPSAHGAWSNGVCLPEQVTTIGGVLGASGYSTALIGKAHFQPLASRGEYVSLEGYPILRDLDFWRSFHGPYYGFEHIELCRNHADEGSVGMHYAPWLEEQGLTSWRDYFRPWPNDKPAPAAQWPYYSSRYGEWELPEELHYNRWISERTRAYLERCTESDKPFLCWASFPDPHPPYVVPSPWANKYSPRDMDPGQLVEGELEAMPAHIRMTQQDAPDFSPWRDHGRLTHGLISHRLGREGMRKTRQDLQRDMAIYFGMIGFVDQEVGRILDSLKELGLQQDTLVVFTADHGHYLGEHGLVDKGPFHYDQGIRVPFLASWRGYIPGGRMNDSLQSLVDLMPTFLTAAGQPDVPTQGVNQLPCWTGDQPAVRQRLLVENRQQETRLNLRTYIDARYKLTIYSPGTDGELYDLEKDPAETANLWTRPEAAGLRAELVEAALRSELGREPLVRPRQSGA